jgi:hypothetical protein
MLKVSTLISEGGKITLIPAGSSISIAETLFCPATQNQF